MVKAGQSSCQPAKGRADLRHQRRRVRAMIAQLAARQRAQHPDKTHCTILVRNMAKGSPVRPVDHLRDWQISRTSCQMGQRGNLHIHKADITIRAHDLQNTGELTIHHDSGIQVKLTIQTADRGIHPIYFGDPGCPVGTILIRPHILPLL